MLRAITAAALMALAWVTATTAVQDQVSRPLTFEVASVRPNTTTGLGVSTVRVGPGGRFRASNVPVQRLIRMAYGLAESDQITGPAWTMEERFDVDAVAPMDIPPNTADGASPELAAMLRALLENRFSLRVQRATRESSIYALVRLNPGGFGPRLRPSECAALAKAKDPATPPAPRGCGERAGPGLLSNRGRSVQRLAQQLSGLVDRTVVDQTGLAGDFDVDLEWAPNTNPSVGSVPATAQTSLPSIFTAVQEQLGLKLEPRREGRPTLVIEGVERPTAN